MGYAGHIFVTICNCLKYNFISRMARILYASMEK